MASDHLPVIFRGQSPDAAIQGAKAWAREQSLTLRTIGSCRPRTDIEATDEGEAYTVVLVVNVPDGQTLAGILTGVALPTLQVAW